MELAGDEPRMDLAGSSTISHRSVPGATGNLRPFSSVGASRCLLLTSTMAMALGDFRLRHRSGGQRAFGQRRTWAPRRIVPPISESSLRFDLARASQPPVIRPITGCGVPERTRCCAHRDAGDVTGKFDHRPVACRGRCRGTESCSRGHSGWRQSCPRYRDGRSRPEPGWRRDLRERRCRSSRSLPESRIDDIDLAWVWMPACLIASISDLWTRSDRRICRRSNLHLMQQVLQGGMVFPDGSAALARMFSLWRRSRRASVRAACPESCRSNRRRDTR